MNHWMQKIKTIWSAHKKSLVLIFIFYVILGLIFFPYEDALQKTLFQLTESHQDVNLKYESSFVGLLPPRVSLKNVEITTPWFIQTIAIDQLIIKPSYLALMALTFGLKVEFVKKSSRVRLWMKNSSFKKRKKLLIQIQSKALNLRHLSFASSFFANAKGIAEFFINFKWDPSFSSPPEGFFQVRGKDMEFQPYSFPKKYIIPMDLPHLTWKTLDGKLTMSKDQVQIEKLVIGRKSGPFYLDSKGQVGVKIGKFRKTIENYNIDLNLILDQKIKSRLIFVDLFLSNVEDAVSKDRFQYSANIQGRALHPPKIKKLKGLK